MFLNAIYFKNEVINSTSLELVLSLGLIFAQLGLLSSYVFAIDHYIGISGRIGASLVTCEDHNFIRSV